MATLRRSLPPLNSLVIFEAAARHLNFTHAASEIGITQAGVSRQIAALEAHLGAPVFQRLPRGLKLTRDGQNLQRAATLGLDHIAKVCGEIRRPSDPADLTVATSVTFASYWLVARLNKFRAAHPEIDLRVVASAPISDLARSGVDVAIRYGRGAWSGMRAERLFGNDIWPVCAPSYMQGRPPFAKPEELLGETLLHLGSFDHSWVTWDDWLKAYGVQDTPQKKGLTFDNYMILLHAALRGDGLALCGERLAEDFIRRGDIIRPIEAALASEREFYLVYQADAPLSPAARAFRDWLIVEAK